jgi:peptide/nickel transport system permease protein
MWWWFMPPVIIIIMLFVGLFSIAAGLDEVANPRKRRVV